ncbi:MAG: hypothetical protein AAGN35_20405 [Bacteroidota bacterium]
MKRNLGIIFILAIAVAAIFLSTSSRGQAEPTEASATIMELPSCPTGTVTVQGCIADEDGCTIVNTTNGRKIYIKILSGVSVGVGDIASLTGQFVTDQDCNPCVLVVQSATDLGDC